MSLGRLSYFHEGLFALEVLSNVIVMFLLNSS